MSSFDHAPERTEDNQVAAARSRRGKNFGGGSMRRTNEAKSRSDNPLSPGGSVLQPLKMQVTKNSMGSPHEKQTKPPAPLLPPDQQTSARRSKFESARLKDENITLNSEITRRVAEVEAHRRFQSRSADTANSLEGKLQDKDEQIRQLEQQKEGLQKTLEDERKSIYRKLADCQKMVKTQEQKEVELDMRLRTIKKAHQEELVLLRRQLVQAQAALSDSKHRNQQNDRNAIAAKPASSSSTVQAGAGGQGTATKATTGASAGTGEESEALKNEMQELKQRLSSMKREMSIKDRQLANLRSELEAQEQANMEQGGGDDYSDVLEEELNMMRSSYEKKLRDAEQRFDEAARSHMRDQNDWERQKKESKHVESGLLMQVDRKAKQLDGLKRELKALEKA